MGNLFAHDIPPFWYQLDLRPVTDLNDDGLEFILSYIKGVKTVYLDGTSITNQAIDLLAQLEYLNELHLSKNKNISGHCISGLAGIKGLEVLNVNQTSFQYGDFQQLSIVTGLREVYCSHHSGDGDCKMLIKEHPAITFRFNEDPFTKVGAEEF